jgi:hypothetical protein
VKLKWILKRGIEDVGSVKEQAIWVSSANSLACLSIGVNHVWSKYFLYI